MSYQILEGQSLTYEKFVGLSWHMTFHRPFVKLDLTVVKASWIL